MSNDRRLLAAWVLLVSTAGGCPQYRQDVQTQYPVRQTWQLDDVGFGNLVQFDGVRCDPDETYRLRRLIIDEAVVKGRDVLEIHSGTGLLSIICLQNGADSVVAIESDQRAVSNTRYNAATLEVDTRLQCRLIPDAGDDPFAVVQPAERFDVILSDPGWSAPPSDASADAALVAERDRNHSRMDRLLDGLPGHLNPGGRCLIVYASSQAVSRLIDQATRRGWTAKVLDPRRVEDLPDDFLPGMVIEVTPQPRDGPGPTAGG